MKRIIAVALGILMAAVVGLAGPATPSLAAPIPTPDLALGPNGIHLGTFQVGTNLYVRWLVTNWGDDPITVQNTAGASGCARTFYPYVSPSVMTIDPIRSRWVYTYITSSCAGSGTVYLTIGSVSAHQYVIFVN